MDIKILEKSGFTQGEIRIYLALLEIGETSTGAIIKKSKITGSKVYEILEKLIEKGLVSYIIRKKTKYFQASSPKRLLDYINKKEQGLKRERKEIESIIPRLEELQKSKQKTQASQIFEGYEGIKTVFSMILENMKKGEEYYAFSIGEELKDENVRLFLQNYHLKRISKKIKVKIIANSNEKKSFSGLSRLKGLEIKYHKNPFPTGVFIFKDYVATLKFKDKPTAFLIKSGQIADSYRSFFEGLWEESKK